MLRSSAFLFVALLGISGLPAAPSRAEIMVIVGPLPTTGEFDLKDKTRRSLSGVACPVVVDGKHICLVAFDEGAEARTNFGISHIRTDGERVLAFTHSGKVFFKT
ncbi:MULTISPECIES: hypothetical protein [Rhizobium]|uniref:hypothetical protein n=1 Tax=Rhizobium TaxID=379 RepID=UPI001C90336F|nr:MULTISPECIES: hypothetical protein [Rhizobium]MBY3173127.1 hypothetical protein [Rhizobium leguminosarum]MBY3366495.1 hypothetical protein [Rhizobium laguerreae]